MLSDSRKKAFQNNGFAKSRIRQTITYIGRLLIIPNNGLKKWAQRELNNIKVKTVSGTGSSVKEKSSFRKSQRQQKIRETLANLAF